MTPTRNSIIEKAIESASTEGYVDVVELTNSCNIGVFTEELPNDRSAFIRYNPEKNTFAIFTNSNQTKQRQRFSIAHELAHFVLHKPAIMRLQEIDRENALSLPVEEEKEADQLAAEILMPAPLVHIFMKEKNLDGEKPLGKPSLEQIANHFNVSMPMAIIRMRELGHYVPFINF